MTHESDNNTRDGEATSTARITESPAYRLAFEDLDFLHDPDLRPVRLQMQRHTQAISTARRRGSIIRRAPRPPLNLRPDAVSPARVPYSRYYEEARRFAQIVSRRFQEAQRRDFVIVTGGGPGIMEAANRGAADVGGRSVALNITLPHEQAPNPFVTQDLCFRFHYFALRKMHFLLRAKALVAFPGGYGTFDELFEALTLVQTGKIDPMPIVLVGDTFWRRAVDFAVPPD